MSTSNLQISLKIWSRSGPLTVPELARLEEVALSAENRCEMRCQFAMSDIYKEAGLLPVDLAIPDGPRDWARSDGRSLIAPFCDGCGYFNRVDGPAIPGDLLGFRLGHTLHHVAIQLSGGRMVHVFGRHGVKIAACVPTEWAKRLDVVWRLK